MCGIHARAGACLLRHGVIEERLWRRDVRPGVRRKFAWSLALPVRAIPQLLALCRVDGANMADCVCA